jgi:acyl-CoA thioester hydrolase
MDTYSKHVEVRWSDLDPNFHLRHSVYYDWGAYARLSFMQDKGITAASLVQLHLGPILFREEAIFKREVTFGDKVTIFVQLSASRVDGSRWSMRHEIYKNEDTLAAIINVDGAWIDTQKRKLAIPPEHIRVSFEDLPRSADFQWEVPK